MSSAPRTPARPHTPRAVVIGGGIGGLTAAVALRQCGWHTTVLERADSLEPVGAGIGLAPNSQRALDVVGLGDTVRALATWHGDGGLRTPSGRWLSRTDSRAAAERFGGPLVPLHRATLIEHLAARLSSDALLLGTSAVLADPGVPAGRPARVTTTRGDIAAELVVAADGIHSDARTALFPGHPGPRYTGVTAWRVVVPALDRPFPPHETWGSGALWGSQPLKDDRIYAYAAAAAPSGQRAGDDEKSELLRRFGDWHDPVPGIIAAAHPEQVLRNDIWHQKDPLPAFHRGRTALLGDAAHAMAPFAGQGGNQAVEDAVVLAHCAPPDADLAAGLAAYTAQRLPRATAVVRLSARIARLATLSNTPAVAVRNTLMAAASRLGPGLVLRTFDGIADWCPPQPTYAAGAAGAPPKRRREPSD
ncbi:FAD-dependent monooxygenase [Streptomyces sp. MUM 178J]|uniref:FAD-dependent monooxygenase n=1 Tax=Streptomyces sp. MUM 178J TaxID=2791991 RepID=UPI001F04ACF3|nr:FAD-dependent monooxygenase [Streptomyces sp. MUM 178J]WRQ78357.1 FAD-dependent monooxygenase [Streptomyces sp. MUM 178J]